MNLSVSWPNARHYLLQNPTVDLDVDGANVPGAMRTGGAEFVLPKGSASPSLATLIVQFTFRGASILRVEQKFLLLPPLKFGGGGPLALNFTVSATGSGDVTLPGSHPLVVPQISALGLWSVMINTRTVDVTNVQQLALGNNLLFSTLNKLARPSPKANVRVLARTDGKFPLRWVTATPPSCTAFADTGVLCFLTAPQGMPKDRDDADFLVNLKKFTILTTWLGTFFGGGVHETTLPPKLPPRGRDHFTRARTPDNPNPFPNVVLSRGWESALMSSGRHVALALPVPSNGGHNAAETVELPKLLSDVHATLVAVGDILAPAGVAVSRRPMLGIAGHSNAGASLYSAVAASLTAFKEIWLFDTNDIRENLRTLALASAANVLLAGFGDRRVNAAHAEARATPSLRGRIRRLPDPEPPPGASPAALAASSPKLTHALTGAGTLDPTGKWTPGIFLDPITGDKFEERFEVLHQQIVQGDDADGRHYLTKALAGSAFR